MGLVASKATSNVIADLHQGRAKIAAILLSVVALVVLALCCECCFLRPLRQRFNAGRLASTGPDNPVDLEGSRSTRKKSKQVKGYEDDPLAQYKVKRRGDELIYEAVAKRRTEDVVRIVEIMREEPNNIFVLRAGCQSPRLD